MAVADSQSPRIFLLRTRDRFRHAKKHMADAESNILKYHHFIENPCDEKEKTEYQETQLCS